MCSVDECIIESKVLHLSHKHVRLLFRSLINKPQKHGKKRAGKCEKKKLLTLSAAKSHVQAQIANGKQAEITIRFLFLFS